MKILQIISYFFPAWSYGGPGKLVHELSKGIGRKHEITVVTTDAFDINRRRNKEDDKSVSENFRLLYYPNSSNYIAYKYKIFIPIVNIFRLRKEVLSSDIIHIHEFFTPLAIIVSSLAVHYQKPYVISSHGTLEALRLQHRGTAKKIFMFMFGNRIIRNASQFIALTSEESEDYKQSGVKESNISLIPNGIDLKEFSNLTKSEGFKRKYQIGKDDKIILFVGRIHKLKGLELLIQAFKEVENKDKKSKLMIVGPDDGYLKYLKEYILINGLKDKVIFTGILSGKGKTDAYANADIFVYPSPSEGHSVAILEAAGAGVPLIITTGCRFNEVETHKAGIVVEVDSKEIATALVKLLENDSLRRQMGINARKLVLQKYDWKTLINKYSLLYESLICK